MALHDFNRTRSLPRSARSKTKITAMDTSSHDRVTKGTKPHLMKYLSWMMTRWFRRFHLQERECRLRCCRRSLLGRLYLKMTHIKLSILLTRTLLRDKINEGNVTVTAPSGPSGQSSFLPLGGKRYSESKVTCLRTTKVMSPAKARTARSAALPRLHMECSLLISHRVGVSVRLYGIPQK